MIQHLLTDYYFSLAWLNGWSLWATAWPEDPCRSDSRRMIVQLSKPVIKCRAGLAQHQWRHYTNCRPIMWHFGKHNVKKSVQWEILHICVNYFQLLIYSTWLRSRYQCDLCDTQLLNLKLTKEFMSICLSTSTSLLLLEGWAKNCKRIMGWVGDNNCTRRRRRGAHGLTLCPWHI